MRPCNSRCLNVGSLFGFAEIFRSLLYEACGRIVNPIYGSVGLLWSGNWQLCQNAVQAVLKGDPVVPITSEAAAATNNEPPLKFCDIRHVNKDENCAVSTDLHRVRTRCRFKKSGAKSRNTRVPVGFSDEEGNRSTSHESSLSNQSQRADPNLEEPSREVESSTVAAESSSKEAQAGDGEIELELTLGLAPSQWRSRIHEGNWSCWLGLLWWRVYSRPGHVQWLLSNLLFSKNFCLTYHILQSYLAEVLLI